MMTARADTDPRTYSSFQSTHSTGFQGWWEKDAKQDIKLYALSFAIALTFRTFVMEPRYIPSLSMFPTFEVGDQLAVDKISVKLARPYQRKDVVVFYPPPAFREFSDLPSEEVSHQDVVLEPNLFGPSLACSIDSEHYLRPYGTFCFTLRST